ncbi:MAG: prolipoprotein diacylglyceryl transferase [Firmicutes bacterium]|nr:prolipoprotein diacylglyceryl transferase [Bacillota bacterium]
MQSIVFPGLGLEFSINIVAFELFGKSIYWYGIIISTGFLLAMVIATKEAKRVGVAPETFMDIVLIATPLAIIGARIYYVIFNWSTYKDNLSEIIAIWHGGLAIYGAIIAALMAAVVYCRIKGIGIWKIFDIAALGFLVGQIIGRWGNFINQEAYGSETMLPWRMEIFDVQQQARIAVHPTFLYESLWNLVGFIFIYMYRKRKKFDGEIFLLYASWYGLGRFWIEGLRTDSLYIGVFRVSQIVAALSVLFGAALLIYFRKKMPKDS